MDMHVGMLIGALISGMIMVAINSVIHRNMSEYLFVQRSWAKIAGMVMFTISLGGLVGHYLS